MSQADGSKITVAMHIHTLYSPCSETKLEEIGDYCHEKGIDVVAITDHDTIGGALALAALTSDVRVIVGEEINTRQGEIVGLFLNHEIEPGLDAEETCERIKEQGGLVYVPHPFDPFKINRLRRHALMRILDMIDIIEVWNGKANLPVFNRFAERFAQSYGKTKAVGSDAHYLEAIGLCSNVMDDFRTPQEFLSSLRNAELVTGHTYPLRTWWVGIKNVLRGEGHIVRRFGRTSKRP